MLANDLSKEINMKKNMINLMNENMNWIIKNIYKNNTLTIKTINIYSGKRALPPLSRAGSLQWKSTTPELRNCQHVLSQWKYYNRVWIKSYSITLLFSPPPFSMVLITYLYIKFYQKNGKPNLQFDLFQQIC